MPIEPTDPLVVLIVWILLALTRRLTGEVAPVVRHVLPFLAPALAAGIYAGIAQVQGEPVTAGAVWRGIFAGSTVVLGHSQFREVLKYLYMVPPPQAVTVQQQVEQHYEGGE